MRSQAQFELPLSRLKSCPEIVYEWRPRGQHEHHCRFRANPGRRFPRTCAGLRAAEAEAFRKARPKTAGRIGNGMAGFLGGVPMHWMKDWPTPFPILVEQARGATITDIDGNRLDDFCLGDTGSMFGHSPAPVARAIRRQAGRGLTYMLPSEDALAIGPLLQEKFGLPFWQIATTATDANRFALRVARAVTGRAMFLVSTGCTRSVDETMVRLKD